MGLKSPGFAIPRFYASEASVNVQALVAPDGSTTYQIDMTSMTPADMAGLSAAPNANVWLAANATVTETVTVQNPPPDLDVPSTDT
jgi:hypothetical protein